MCLFSKPDYDIEFENARPRPRRRKVIHVQEQRRERVSETRIHEHHSSQYVPAPQLPSPRTSAPIIRAVTPPYRAPSPPRSPRLELVSVEERNSPRGSRVSVSGKSRGHGRHGSRSEVYIERERVRERVPPPAPEYDTYRYVPGTGGGDDIGRRRSRSITYETNPRNSGRMVERERVVVEDNGRRREYYRKA